MVVVIAAAAGGVALENGAADGFLAARVRSALQHVLGDDLAADLQGATIRIAADGKVELRARGVSIRRAADGTPVAGLRTIDLALAPMPLLSGNIAVEGLVVDGISLDPETLGSGEPITLDSLRVDGLPDMMDRVFAGSDRLLRILDGGEVGRIEVTDTRIASAGAGSPPIDIAEADLTRGTDGTVRLSGTLSAGGAPARFTARALPGKDGRHIASMAFDLEGFDTAPLMLQRAPDGTPIRGVATDLALKAAATRKGDDAAPALTARLSLSPGQFYAHETAASIKGGTVDLAYRFDRKSIDIRPSSVSIGQSRFPFTGGIIDLSNLDTMTGNGFALDLVSNGSSVLPLDSGEPPVSFNAKILARYLKGSRELSFKQLSVSTPLGSLAGSLEIDRGGRSPEISFAGTLKGMKTAAIKQLWPFWLGVHARQWVMNNLYGGAITNGSIKVYIPQGKIAESGGKLDLDENEFSIDFDYADARLNVAGDIPPLRDAKGHFRLRGPHLTVSLDQATGYFPTGRTVDISKGVFAIADTDKHPVMANLDITVAGEAAAVAELVSYEPIDALKRTDFSAKDFSGDVVSRVHARFGLIRDQNPPPPDWHVEATLNGVDLAQKVDGRAFTDLDGSLTVDPDKAVLDADARIDGIPMHVALTRPLGTDSPVERAQVVTASLGTAAQKALMPGLATIVDGPIDMTMREVAPDTQAVSADLKGAKITIPGLEWTKGAGIPATVSLTTHAGGKGDIAIRDFTLHGSGFSVKGAIDIDDGHFTNAHFSDVRLSERDRFAATVKRDGAGFEVDVDGTTLDARSVIEGLHGSSGAKSEGAATPVRIDADLDRLYGFNGEKLEGVHLSYAGAGKRIDRLNLSAKTSGGAVISARTDVAGPTRDFTLATGDAGTLARFADVYGKLNGGRLTARLSRTADGPYRGTVDIRDFSIDRENRLNSIVSMRSPHGQSLRDTTGEPLDLSEAEFQRGFTRLTFGNGSLAVADGVLRGTRIGATFQGTVFDPNGQMAITGTFMPAYGLNRIFGEVPLIGAILGNGRDRGLIGITFKLTGKVSSPDVQINPLSVIAPGVFRRIFEF
ncbi:YhdP family protein [Pararhizobium mangrovi]|uniref:YhdP central domain-containing protein n=1 Tax=Pararhizobium mangrovi TaxID=2590452 RepID=A0A506U4K7_9HYPH|nr:DUF3971 domain-containing protein [Pararhizobium mangrovi]TPW26817.1 hypothetical protein FJU11_13500 [Pararhizobium mangrovi]